ncbi:hypothetical protein Desor_4858 [Desulfosporosinus orientis DSM 765]|uniref:Uncharacterized protein n=1 Tax=Desulfosporosinus orientis (strain ATCC 19365 / DSM 765 / NCIMB 8382 / VKM B-1628 / Singapore I) TaxID=768706 RepID=G7WHW2_DESOD|nr:hypothetical protein [Desulfosporosinus orientis]AET70259.1 hypothetical protein Desor_4858 [Desulfosporosinus orientis DSM 765]
MSNTDTACPLSQTAHQAVVLPFRTRAQSKEQFSPCIFCGKTMRVHIFKGKTVCDNCLRQIPAIFSCG